MYKQNSSIDNNIPKLPLVLTNNSCRQSSRIRPSTRFALVPGFVAATANWPVACWTVYDISISTAYDSGKGSVLFLLYAVPFESSSYTLSGCTFAYGQDDLLLGLLSIKVAFQPERIIQLLSRFLHYLVSTLHARR